MRDIRKYKSKEIYIQNRHIYRKDIYKEDYKNKKNIL